LFYIYFVPVNRNITLFAYANAVAGILAELAALLPHPDELTFYSIRTFFSGFWLDFLNFRLLFWGYLNGLNMIANVLLFLGAWQFAKSNGKNNRLLSYTLAVLTISSAFSLIEIIFYNRSWLAVILNVLKCSTIVYFSWKFLKYINESKEPQLTGDANEGQRAVNWLIDTTTIFAAMTPFMFTYSLIGFLENNLGSRWAMIIFYIIARLIYYIFFEITFRATPGKLATGTEVISDDELLPNPTQIVTRTFARFIPFEPLSFFVTRGWHDSLSQTKVVKTKQIE
jgi:hypothetical protein